MNRISICSLNLVLTCDFTSDMQICNHSNAEKSWVALSPCVAAASHAPDGFMLSLGGLV
jgi:hypothetical protein